MVRTISVHAESLFIRLLHQSLCGLSNPKLDKLLIVSGTIRPLLLALPKIRRLKKQLFHKTVKEQET